jgi:hypothetical protein
MVSKVTIKDIFSQSIKKIDVTYTTQQLHAAPEEKKKGKGEKVVLCYS